MVRVKRRYLTIHFNPEDPKITPSMPLEFSESDVVRALRECVHTIHGDYGLGSILRSLSVKKVSPATRIAIVSCQRGPHELLVSSIPLVNKIKETMVSLQLIYMSGTMRSSNKFLIKKYRRDNFDLMKRIKKEDGSSKRKLDTNDTVPLTVPLTVPVKKIKKERN